MLLEGVFPKIEELLGQVLVVVEVLLIAPEARNALLETSEVRLDVKRLLFAAFLDRSYPLSTRASGRIRAKTNLCP